MHSSASSSSKSLPIALALHSTFAEAKDPIMQTPAEWLRQWNKRHAKGHCGFLSDWQQLLRQQCVQGNNMTSCTALSKCKEFNTIHVDRHRNLCRTNDASVLHRAGSECPSCDDRTAAAIRSFHRTRLSGECQGRGGISKHLVLVDKACNGCGRTLDGRQNLWHRMTRMFTVWRTLKAQACESAPSSTTDLCGNVSLSEADLLFTNVLKMHLPLGNSSWSGWKALVGGRVFYLGEHALRAPGIDWCEYATVTMVPSAPFVKIGKKGEVTVSSMVDSLWSLADGARLRCSGTAASRVWQSFTQDLLRGMRLSPIILRHRTALGGVARESFISMASTTVCLLLRRPMSAVTPPSTTTTRFVFGGSTLHARYESDPGAIVHALSAICMDGTPREQERLRVLPLFFRSSEPLRVHAEQMSVCDVSMGVHGAQMMNVMWMPPGSVVEFRLSCPYGAPKCQGDFYHGVAELSGHRYFSRRVRTQSMRLTPNKTWIAVPAPCPEASCAGFATSTGATLLPAQLQSVAMAAVAAAGPGRGRALMLCSTSPRGTVKAMT